MVYKVSSRFNVKFGFTLIELLIVIVIIGILAGSLIPRIQAAQGRARDAQRKSHMRTIVTSLELYFLDTQTYPKVNITTDVDYNRNDLICTQLYNKRNDWIKNLTGYLYPIPIDPINNDIRPYWLGGYSYCYGAVYNPANTGVNTLKIRTYDLMMNLENDTDPLACKNVRRYMIYNNTAGICGGSYSSSFWSYSPNRKNTP